MTTYRVVADGQFKIPEKSARYTTEERGGLTLPMFAGVGELHHSVFALPEKKPVAVEQFDLHGLGQIRLDDKPFDLGGKQHGLAASQLIDTLGENNPLALLIAHGVISQHHFTFSSTQCLRDGVQGGHQIKSSIAEVAIQVDGGGVNLTINSSVNEVQKVDAQYVGTVLDAENNKTLCDIETTYRFTEQASAGDAKYQYGLEEGATRYIGLEIVSHNVTVNDNRLYSYNNLLSRYRAMANPEPGALSQCCLCLCGSPKAPTGFAAESKVESAVVCAQPAGI